MSSELPPLPESPRFGELWQHAKGGVYKCLGMAYVESTLEIAVVYHDGKNIWVRPHAEFMDRFRFLVPSDETMQWGKA